MPSTPSPKALSSFVESCPQAARKARRSSSRPPMFLLDSGVVSRPPCRYHALSSLLVLAQLLTHLWIFFAAESSCACSTRRSPAQPHLRPLPLAAPGHNRARRLRHQLSRVLLHTVVAFLEPKHHRSSQARPRPRSTVRRCNSGDELRPSPTPSLTVSSTTEPALMRRVQRYKPCVPRPPTSSPASTPVAFVASLRSPE